MTDVTQTQTLTEFLLACIADDEAVARAAVYWIEMVTTLPRVSDAVRHAARHDPARVLAECEAKRRIIYISETAAERIPPKGDGWEEARARQTLRHLAAVYADRPGYREEWRP